MSEFVECQNCGRRFFAENIECPYCHGEEPPEAERVVPIRRASGTGGLYDVLFGSFRLLMLGIAVLSFLSMSRAVLPATRMILGAEAILAMLTFVGLTRRKRWGRGLAIVVILGNALLGILDLLQRGQGRSLVWGPGPLALLLFLLPFLSPQARERFSR